jgi:hypothetical protein
MSHSLRLGCPVRPPTLTGTHQGPEAVSVPVPPGSDR